MSFVRSSKYRHIFGKSNPKETFNGITLTDLSADSTFCAASPKFFAIVVRGAGGGRFLVLPIQEYGRVATDQPVVSGHKDKVIDLAFSPFHDNIIVSSSEDLTIKVWEIPDEGITEELTEPIGTLTGHTKKVTVLQWHPTAEFILASGGNDAIVRVWNVSQQECVYEIRHEDVIYGISWNLNGSLMATMSKNKSSCALNVFDVRADKKVYEKEEAYNNPKASKCAFLKDGRIFTSGFEKGSKRSIKIWDMKKSDAIVTEEVDQANSTLFLHYDPDNNVMFVIGKGETQIRYYEITDEAPFLHFLSLHAGQGSQNAFCFLAKRGLDVTKCEIARCYRFVKDKCELVSLIVPRKSDLFQSDIYPDCVSDEPALQPDEWISGKNADPKKMSMEALFKELKGSSGGGVAKKASKPLRALSSRSTKAATLSVAASQDSGDAGFDVAKMADEMKKMQETLSKVCKRLDALEKKL